MNRSSIFFSETYIALQNQIRDFLNQQTNYMSQSTINSPRAVGDAIENIIVQNFGALLGDLAQNYSPTFSRRAMADLAFEDKDSFYYIVDVKTHRLDTRFNMPNLTSVERLTRFYEDDKNYFVVMKLSYEIQEDNVHIQEVLFVPIEFLSWECLTIGALGWGQIQIANANRVQVIPGNSRKRWMIDLCDILLAYYPREIAKINDRINHFEKIKAFWEARTD